MINNYFAFIARMLSRIIEKMRFNSTEEQEAHIAMFCVWASLPIIQKQNDYIPSKEFELICKYVEKFQSDRDAVLDMESKNIVESLSEILIKIYLILQQRICGVAGDNYKRKFDSLIQEKYRAAQRSSYSCLTDKTDCDCDNLSKTDDAKTDIEKLFRLFTAEKLHPNEFIAKISSIYERNIDKNSITYTLLQCYKDIYNEVSKYSNFTGVSYANIVATELLLKHIDKVFATILKQISIVDFTKLLNDIDFKLQLTNTINSITKECYYYHYARYLILLCRLNDQNDYVYDYASHLDDGYYSAILVAISTFVEYIISDEPDLLSHITTSSKLFAFIQYINQCQKQRFDVEYKSFVDLVIKTNAKAPLLQQKNINVFLLRYYENINQVIAIMDIEGIKYMRKQVAWTILPLVRMLDQIVILPNKLRDLLHDYFEKCNITHEKNMSEIEAFVNCLTALGILIFNATNYADSSVEFCHDRYLPPQEQKDPDEYLTILVKLLFSELFPRRTNVKLHDDNIASFMSRVKPEYFLRLVMASRHMEGEYYQEVYFKLLWHYLTLNDVDQFLHDKNQHDEVGKALATHNCSIRDVFREHGINATDALNYTKTFLFIVTDGYHDDEDIYNNLLYALWTYLCELWGYATKEEQNTKLSEKNRQRISAICKQIDTLKQTLQNSRDQLLIVDKLKKQQGSINKIYSNLGAIVKDSCKTSAEFKEFSQHVLDQKNAINNCASTKAGNKRTTTHYFRAEQWSKTKLETLFLGDDVGCCLATNNSQFQAMVQRIMDDAMLFHVAIDMKTQKPAALMWLYLAKTEKDSIVLVANFCEVNIKYAHDNTLRKSLLHGLLYFTQQYLNDNPNISKFYLNPLTYGHNVGDLDAFQLEYSGVYDKVGGAFTLDYECTSTTNLYYLTSLEGNKLFHKFEHNVLIKETGDSFMALQDKIEHEITKISPTTTIEEIKPSIINALRLDLSFFFDMANIRHNPEFNEMVESAYIPIPLQDANIGEFIT